MEQRKIIKFGNSSYVVTLPQEWLEEHGLEKGDSLHLSQGTNSLVFSTNSKSEMNKKAVISIDKKQLKLFNKELLSYYLKNYKTIEIVGESVLDRLEEIKRFREKISSVEITEITKEKVVLRDLTSPSELQLDSLLKELFDMEKLFFDELCSGDMKTKFHFLVELDSNINKLSFLSYKSINYSLQAQDDLQKVCGAIHYWRVISSIEEIGDILKRVARYLRNDKNNYSPLITTIVAKIKAYFIFITDLFLKEGEFENDLDVYLDKKQTLLREIEELRSKFSKDMNLYLVLSQLFKDVLGKLDTIVLSVIDLKFK
jgi:phosphate uptake regulator